MDPGPADTSSKTKTKTPVDLPLTEDHGKSDELRKDRSSSSSSSTSSSDDDDYFQIDTGELEKPMQAGTSHDGFEFQQPTQSPQVQVMGLCNVPDPNRIPSSVFARNKSTSPMEWSVTSNESLFSIHMGNSSFSRDHILLMGSSSTDNYSFSPSQPPPLSPPVSPKPKPKPKPKPMPSHAPLSPRPPISPVTVSQKQVQTDHVEPAELANSGTGEDVQRVAAEEKNESEKNKATPPGPDLMNNSASISRQSDGSTTSFRSFAFPILTGEGRSGSIKVEPEPQQQSQSQSQSQSDQLGQQQSPKTETPKTAAPATDTKGWLSCFSCCSFCC